MKALPIILSRQIQWQLTSIQENTNRGEGKEKLKQYGSDKTEKGTKFWVSFN